MKEMKKGNETKAKKVKNEKQYTPENPAVKKKQDLRKVTGDLTDTQQSESKRKKTDTWTTEEKARMVCKQRRGDKEDTESKDAEQPKAVEQEKETRSRRTRVRITNKEDNAIVQKPTTETPDDVKTYEMNTYEKDTKRNKLEHKEHDPPD